MNRFRQVRYLLCLFLLLSGVLGGLFGGQVVLAAQESSNNSPLLPPNQEQPQPEEPTEDKLELVTRFPILESTAGSIFTFEVTFDYQGSKRRVFDLNLILPPGWGGIFMSSYPEAEISAFEPEPGQARQDVDVLVAPSTEKLPEPGEYVFTVEATSGDVSDSIELKAIVTPAPLKYRFNMWLSTLRNDIQLRAGEDNHVSLLVINAESGSLENIALSSETPEGWNVVFTPSKVETLEPGVTQEVDVLITMPPNTEAGDYPIMLRGSSEKFDYDLELRAEVLGTTAWGGVGVGVTIAVIVGLVFWFRRAGRRRAAETTSPGA